MNFTRAFTTDWINGKEIGQRIIAPGIPNYPEGDYNDIAKGGYQKNAILYAGMNEISSSVASINLQAFDSSGKIIERHPTIDLFARPNSSTTAYELKELWALFLLLSGNAFFHKVFSGRGTVTELWPLRPDRVQIIGSGKPDQLVESYRYTVNGSVFPVGREEIIHWKMPNPLNDLFGQSPIQAALREVATDNEGTDFRKVTLENRAMPGIAIETDEEVTKPLITRLTEQWMQRFGKSNRGKPAFLQKGMKIHELGMSMTEMAMPELTAISEARILSVLGVPPILVGAKVGLDKSTYANYEQARESFWDETISSHLSRFEAGINSDSDLTNGFRFSFRFKLDDAPAFRNRQTQREQMARENLIAGLITRNEARLKIGMPPVDGGDVFLVSFSIVSVPASTQQEPEAKSDGKRSAKQLGLLAQALGRNRFADRFESKIEEWAVKEYNIRAMNVRDAVNESSKSGSGLHRKAAIIQIEASAFSDIDTKAENADSAFVDDVMAIIEGLRPTWDKRTAESVLPLMSELITGSMALAADHIGVNADEFLLGNDSVVKFIEDYHFKFARAHVATSVKDVRDAMQRSATEGLTIEETKRTLLKDTFDKWTTKDANRVARTETIRSANAGAREAYRQAGITKLEWLATDDACPYCIDLNGHVIGVSETFVDPDEVFQPEGAAAPLNLNYESEGILHPPAHPNCRCTILPVIE